MSYSAIKTDEYKELSSKFFETLADNEVEELCGRPY